MPLIELHAFDELNCIEQIQDYYVDNFSLPKEEDTELRNSLKANKEARLLTKEERIKYKEEVKKKAIESFEKLNKTPLFMHELKDLGIILSADLSKYKSDIANIDNKIENHADEENFLVCGFLTELKNIKSKKGSYYGYIKIVDQHFNEFEIITRSTTVDNIKQRDNFKLTIGQFVKAEVCKKGGTRLFLIDEKILALDDCI